MSKEYYGIETAILDHIIGNSEDVKKSLSHQEINKVCSSLKRFLNSLNSAKNDEDVDKASLIFSDEVTDIPYFLEKLDSFKEDIYQWRRGRRGLGLRKFANIGKDEKIEGIVTNILEAAPELGEKIKRAMIALGCES